MWLSLQTHWRAAGEEKEVAAVVVIEAIVVVVAVSRTDLWPLGTGLSAT